MAQDTFIKFVELLSCVYSSLIIIIYFLNAHWTIEVIELEKFYNLIDEKMYRWTRVLDIIASIGIIIAFFYILFQSIIGVPFNITTFAIIVIRPLILLLGSAEASHAYIKLGVVLRKNKLC